jgi:hypothetical protein
MKNLFKILNTAQHCTYTVCWTTPVKFTIFFGAELLAQCPTPWHRRATHQYRYPSWVHLAIRHPVLPITLLHQSGIPQLSANATRRLKVRAWWVEAVYCAYLTLFAKRETWVLTKSQENRMLIYHFWEEAYSHNNRPRNCRRCVQEKVQFRTR